MVQVLEQSTAGSRIGRSLGEGVGDALQLLIDRKMKTLQQEGERKAALDEYEDLIKRGFTPQEIGLWLHFTEGGKTHLSKEIVERIQREGGFERRGLPGKEENGLDLLKQKDVTPSLEGEEDTTPSIEAIEGEKEHLTPRERNAREEIRYKINLPLFQAAQVKVKSHESEALGIQRLQKLNKTGKLPKGLQRWNVNFTTGELRVPFLANADTQAFVKTINDFTTKAKDSFGARVTNFELKRFMKRLPTLLNTDEGREVVLRQMEIVNQINTLYDQGTLDIFDRAGGVRKIDWDQAQRKGEKQTAPMIALYVNKAQLVHV